MIRHILIFLGLSAGIVLAMAGGGLAHDAPAENGSAYDGGTAHDKGTDLHFSHPLIAESPSPDTKIRLDHFYVDKEAGDAHTARLEAEYAFAPWISLEVDVPYTTLDPDGADSRSNLDTVEIGLKLASFAFQRHGLIVGGGIEFGLPTGEEDKGIGSDSALEVEPFLDIGVRHGDVEAIAFVAFAIPTNEDEEEADEVDLEVGFNAAVLYHLTPHVAPLLEVDGHTVAAGEDNKTVVNITPGLVIRPFANRDFVVGFGVSFPVTGDEAFDVRTVVSAFLHF